MSEIDYRAGERVEIDCTHLVGATVGACAACIARAIAAAEERGRRAGIEERDRLRALLREASLWVSSDKLRVEIDAALVPRDSVPARYCDEPHPDRPLRCGRFVKHDGPHTAFVPGFEDEQRAAVHWEDRK